MKKKSLTKRKTIPIQVHISPELYQRACFEAKRQESTLSQFVRTSLLFFLERVTTNNNTSPTIPQ